MYILPAEFDSEIKHYIIFTSQAVSNLAKNIYISGIIIIKNTDFMQYDFGKNYIARALIRRIFGIASCMIVLQVQHHCLRNTFWLQVKLFH